MSDVHLGFPSHEESLERERLLVQWLKEAEKDAAEIYLLGDIFDFWFEYKSVVPRGYTRFLGTLAEITDKGIPVHYFTGNHDIWVFDYLPTETGVCVHREPIIKEWNGKRFYLAHGDGLGPFDKNYKLLKAVFTNKFLQWCFKRIHPNFSIGLAYKWSNHSRKKHHYPKQVEAEKEWLVRYARMVLQKEHFDFFIFGHRHIPYQVQLEENSLFTNLGDWIKNFSYAVFDGERLELRYYRDENQLSE